MVSDEDCPLKQQELCPNLSGEFLGLAQRHNAHLRGRGVINMEKAYIDRKPREKLGKPMENPLETHSIVQYKEYD